MKTKLSLIIMVSVLVLISSCDLFNKPEADGRIVINNNAAQLAARVEVCDDIVPFNGIDNRTLGKMPPQGPPGEEDDSTNFVLVLRAEVDAPVYEGSELRASHVAIEDGYAYVTYNKEGEGYLGGIDVFDVSDISNPQLVSQAIITDTDISAVVYKDGALYLAEAVSPYDNDSFETPAVLEKMILDNGLLSTNTIQRDLSSYVATDVKAGSDKVYVTTGDDGHIYIIDPDTLAIDTMYAITDARSVDVNDNKVAVLSASPFVLSLYEQASGSFLTSYTVGGNTLPESKSEVELDDNYAYITENDGGLKVVDINTGQIVDEMDRPETAEGGDDIDYVTNSVSINEELVLIANGAAGVWVGSKYDGDEIEIYGSMEFQSSTNYVEGKDDVIFVATGFGGFRILEVQRYVPEEGDFLTLGDWDENGLPYYLETEKDSIDDSLVDDIHNAIPWVQSSPDLHPEYFDSTQTNLIMTETAGLYVTYIYESAGFKNTLGFYTYDPANPPASPEDIDDMTVIFPNSSMLNSGGSLESGHTVYLGEFPVGTAVGFFLVSYGWSNGEVTEGLYSHYTNYDINFEEDSDIRQHTVLLKDLDRSLLVMGFEDVSRQYESCDQDFDDTVFLIKSVPENAYQTNDIPDLK